MFNIFCVAEIRLNTIYYELQFNYWHRRSVGKNSDGAQQWRSQKFDSKGTTNKKIL